MSFLFTENFFETSSKFMALLLIWTQCQKSSEKINTIIKKLLCEIRKLKSKHKINNINYLSLIYISTFLGHRSVWFTCSVVCTTLTTIVNSPIYLWHKIHIWYRFPVVSNLCAMVTIFCHITPIVLFA